MTISEYENKMRNYGVSDEDIQFILNVYKKHSEDNSGKNETYQKFCCNAIADGLNPNDIRTAIEAFEKLR